MDDFMIEFKEIQTEDAALTVVDLFVESVLDEKGLKTKLANDFFSQCLANLENPSSSPKAKFYTVYMLKELSMKENLTKKLFGPFSNHQLFTFLEDTAVTIDPKKPMEQKGKTLFASDKITGNNFMRLILESLLTWGYRFGSNRDKPTRFTATLDRFTKSKIVVPSTYQYYQKKTETSITPDLEPRKEESKKQVPQNSTPSAPSAPKAKESKQKYASEIKFMANKIQTLLSIIEDEDEPEQIQREVTSYHQKFTKDFQKLQASQQEMIEGQSEDIIGLYFKLLEFFGQEKDLYNRHVKNDDYATYISGYSIAYEKMYEQSKMKKPSSRPPKEKPSIEQKIKANVPPPRPVDKVEKYKSEVEPKSRESLRRVDSKTNERQNRITDASKELNNFLSRLDTSSKSPNVGFSSLAKSMSREKQSTIVPRKKNPVAMSNFNKSIFGASSAAKSTVNLKSIFASPPNPSLRSRNYEGELVLPLGDLNNARESILKLQGHRRFKASHFKSKYILYEDDYIQIGFKITQAYEKVNKFSAMLIFELYFGNKTQKLLKKLALHFQGDKESLIYTSPQLIQSSILPMAQIKLELLNIPKRIPFGHIQVQVAFDVEWETHRVSAYLPNSILQMGTYYNIQPHIYASSWADCVKILKTEAFPLCHYFPPKQLSTLISNLSQRTSYEDFSAEGSTTDYELYTEVILQESYQGILKINIRPDLTVVLQAGIYESEEQCLKNFKFYLQALEMVLRKGGQER